jgi:hydrogenase maturation protein HypF
LILGQKKQLAAGINNGLSTTGALLPYMPIHYLMFNVLNTPAVVLTSGNMSEEPIITDDAIAVTEFAGIADALISYNRKIVNRTDDSVVRIIDHRPLIIRRSRGYAPRPVDLRRNAEGILALGAEQKNSFCMGKGNQAILSQYIGDLKNKPTYDFLKEAIDRFSILFRFKPLYLACDLHPDYLSTQYAELLRDRLDIPLFRVQHHHAHIASCMAEHGLDEPVIGISFDGTGLGTDGTLWGGEFLVAELRDFIRYSYFDPVPLPGGEKAILEPWRTACSYLIKYMGRDFDLTSVPALKQVGESKLRAIGEMLSGKVHSPLSSGAGRLFDAVAAMLGLCTYETFDSEAPVRLESAICDHTEEFYPFTAGKPVIFKDTFSAIIKELTDKSPSLIAAKFHNTIALVILEVSEQIRRETSLNKVVLSGGVFQNKYLLERSLYLLRRNRFLVYTNNAVPANDGGISLGQLIIASKSIF